MRAQSQDGRRRMPRQSYDPSMERRTATTGTFVSVENVGNTVENGSVADAAPTPQRSEPIIFGLDPLTAFGSCGVGLRLGSILIICLCLASAAWGQSQATPVLPAGLERPGAVSAEQRTTLRHELERHASVLESQSAALKIVAKLVGPSVVHIEADVPAANPPEAGRTRHAEESGSGVTIEYQGKLYVLTNWHVVRNATPEGIRIHSADGRLVNLVKVLTDPETDVAVLAVESPGLVPASLGDSDRMETGDFVLAIGSPFGLNHSVTLGIISASGRRELRLIGGDKIRFQDFLQTDAAINPGNSGGPLVNLRGEVIGINDAIASQSGFSEGVGFAIPVNMFMAVGRQLIATGKVARAFLGVNLNAKFGPAMATELGLPRPMGAHVTGITPNSPAETAKLRPGDVILKFNHIPVEDDAHLVNLVSLTEVGKSVPLLIFRDRQTITVAVEVGDRSKFGQ